MYEQNNRSPGEAQPSQGWNVPVPGGATLPAGEPEWRPAVMTGSALDGQTVPISEQPTHKVVAVKPRSAPTSQRMRRRNIIAAIVVVALLAGAIPSSLIAYGTYSHVKALALDGVRHLEAIKNK